MTDDMPLPGPRHAAGEDAAAEERTSALLHRIAMDMPSDRVALGALVEALGDRGFAIVLLVLAVPNSLPIPSPPGFSTVFGVPLAFFSAQMMLGRASPWLPQRMLRRTVSRRDFRLMVAKILPWLERLERYCRPRGRALTGRTAERFLGAVYLLLSVLLALPIPGGNFPPGLSMTIMSLGLLEKDGRMVGIGLAVAAVATAVVSFIAVVSFHLIVGLLQRFLP
ncbi:ABC transporter permease [Allostella vacuolata]|nr:ABC transporter permease [Stella vacuolata]